MKKKRTFSCPQAKEKKVLIRVDIGYNFYNEKISYQDYLRWTEKWLKRCDEVLKDDGRFCLNIPRDENKGGQQSVYADITTLAKKIGFRYHSTIIGNEGNISRRTAWGSWLSASAPYVIAPVEVIVVLYKSKKGVGHFAPFPGELPRRWTKIFSLIGDTVLDPFSGSGTTLVAFILTEGDWWEN